MRILLQFPEGLKQYALKYAEQLEKEGNEVIISASPSYGGCDVALDEARAIKADKIIHFGHNEFIKWKPKDIEIEYVPYRIDIKISFEDFVKELKKNKIKSISLATTVQHTHQIKELKEYFESKGINVKTGRGIVAREEAQILGCDARALVQEADAYVIIADGVFHAYGVEEYIELDKPVYLLNSYSGKFRMINGELEKRRKRKRAAIIKAIYAKNIAVIVSTKAGQFNFQLAKAVKKKLEELGKKAYILVTSEVIPSALENFLHFDAFVVTACPRLADDMERFGKPMLNISMFVEMVEILSSKTSLRKEQFFENY